MEKLVKNGDFISTSEIVRQGIKLVKHEIDKNKHKAREFDPGTDTATVRERSIHG